MTSGCIFKNGAPMQVLIKVRILTKFGLCYPMRFMLSHERERKSKENANFIHIVYLLAKLCNIFGFNARRSTRHMLVSNSQGTNLVQRWVFRAWVTGLESDCQNGNLVGMRPLRDSGSQF